MTTEITTTEESATFDPGTSRDGFLAFVQGLPEGFVPPAQEEQKPVEHVLVEDRAEHLHMFPPNGVHAPGVSRYPSGFRNWHDTKLNK